MKCWICGNESNSGEHMLKASDLKLWLPDISQKKPIYKHTPSFRNVKIGSGKSNHLKSSARLCKNCNNNLTQPYDRAWEKLSKYLYHNLTWIVQNGSFNLEEVFSGESPKKMTCLQLYFIKLTGCLFFEAGLDDLAQELAKSIKAGTQRKDIFLEFYVTTEYPIGIEGPKIYKNNNDKIIQAGWIYSLGKIFIIVHYLSDNVTLSKNLWWNPVNSSKIINIQDSDC